MLFPAAPLDWQIKAERTAFAETDRYAATMEYCRRLDEESDQAKLIRIGRSPQGRDVVIMILSKEGHSTAPNLRTSGKPLLFFNNGIHSGEIEGKDASMMLMRDILVTGTKKGLLDRANLAFVPIFSVDGHERFSAYSRANQNGPAEMGWRTTAQNLNLNRDWVKADAPEMRGLIRWLAAYKPDVFFDNHTTDGGDWQYVLTHDTARWPTMDEGAMRLAESLDQRLLKDVNEAGFAAAPYFSGIDPARPERGASLSTYSPRFSHGYYHLFNRPSVLIETHVLKPYEPRVKSTYAAMESAINWASEMSAELRAAVAVADARESAMKEGDSIVVTARSAREGRPWTYLGYAFTPRQSELTGGQVRDWDHSQPITVETTLRDRFEPASSAALPAAWLIPAEWKEAIDLVTLHGFRTQRLQFPGEGIEREMDVMLLKEARFATAPNEGRFSPQFRVEPGRRKVFLANGSVVVSASQPGVRLLHHMLEPEPTDSLVKWGFFNAIFQRTEYAEDYALEPIAQKMLASDPALKAEFEKRLAEDPAFAASPQARLMFFYERSPYYDQTHEVYPVLRLTAAELAELTAAVR